MVAAAADTRARTCKYVRTSVAHSRRRRISQSQCRTHARTRQAAALPPSAKMRLDALRYACEQVEIIAQCIRFLSTLTHTHTRELAHARTHADTGTHADSQLNNWRHVLRRRTGERASGARTTHFIAPARRAFCPRSGRLGGRDCA